MSEVAPDHPSVKGPLSLKQRGVWVRDLKTDHIGYISYVEKFHDRPPKLWIVFPAKPVNKDLSIHAAGSASVEEVRVLRKRHRERFARPFPT